MEEVAWRSERRLPCGLPADESYGALVIYHWVGFDGGGLGRPHLTWVTSVDGDEW